MAQTRQIHLDFHCSEALKDIGDKFNKYSFQKILNSANINSINLFAKCHHSWSYYPTKIGKMHPNLKFDLLGSQIAACKEIGIKTYIYFTVGWSANDAEDNPSWCARNSDGSFIINGQGPEYKITLCDKELPNFYWKFMCVNSGYSDLIFSQVEELLVNYDVDGFWFDIYQANRLCYCAGCKESMLSSGIDYTDTSSVETFNSKKIKDHLNKLKKLIHKYSKNAEIFFNGTTAIDNSLNFHHQIYDNNTVQDLEDLPTTWGGYDKLPLQSKFFINAGYPITAMSGKFHTEWGEFGGFKHPDALKYEASQMIAFGANCNFGDQLHPNGEVDVSTYENIGYAYDYVKKIEAFGVGGKPISKLGIWRSFVQASDEGVSKMLLEKQIDFDVANFCEKLSKFDVIIFPSGSKLSKRDTFKVKEFIKSGGSIIALAESLLNFVEGGIAKDFGLKFLGPSSMDCDYTLIEKALYPVFVKTPFLNYKPAIQSKPVENVEVLAYILEPYFNRTPQHYCSHQKTPFKETKSPYPAITRHGNCIYIAHELDSMYNIYGARIHRDIFVNSLNLLYKNPMLKVDLPSAARINLLHQENQKRYVLHLLYSSPVRRGITSVIEDSVTLYDIKVIFKLPEKISSVRLIPDEKNLKINKQGSYSFVTIPEFKMHCALAFHYF